MHLCGRVASPVTEFVAARRYAQPLWAKEKGGDINGRREETEAGCRQAGEDTGQAILRMWLLAEGQEEVASPERETKSTVCVAPRNGQRQVTPAACKGTTLLFWLERCARPSLRPRGGETGLALHFKTTEWLRQDIGNGFFRRIKLQLCPSSSAQWHGQRTKLELYPTEPGNPGCTPSGKLRWGCRTACPGSSLVTADVFLSRT